MPTPRRISRLVFQHRRALLVAFALLLIAASIYGAGAPAVLVAGGFDDPGAESAGVARLLEAELGVSQPDLVVAWTTPGQPLTEPSAARAVQAAIAELRASPGVQRVSSPFDEPPTALVSADRRTVVLQIELAGDATAREAAYTALAPRLRPPGLETLVGGAIPATREAQDMAERDLVRAELITLPLLAVLLVVFFRGLVLALLPLLVGGFAVAAALAWLRLLTLFTEVSVFAMNIVTFIGLGLAVDYSLFMTSRFREELATGHPVPVALSNTLHTAGRTIAWSGLAVAASLLGLLVFPMMMLRSVALSGSLVVLMALLATLVFLPAGLAVLGRRVEWLSIGAPPPASGATRGAWHRLAHLVMRAPATLAVAVTAFLLLLGAPFLHMNATVGGVAALPAHAEARRLHDLLESARFPAGAAGPIPIALTTAGPASSPPARAAVERYRARLLTLPGVTRADPIGERGTLTGLRVLTPLEPESLPARRLVEAIRAIDVSGVHARVGGDTARLLDARASMAHHVPRALALICLFTFIVLFLAFGSVVMPIKAIAMNVLSLTASFGALVWIFQDGRFEDLLGYTANGAIEMTIPVVMFAVVFGLAMDYELFLLSRIREAYDESGDTRTSVAIGLEQTGRIITRAALLLIAVMLGFASAHLLHVKELGVGMAIAIAVDATIVRALLVPATMQLLGRLNWWSPRWLTRLWRRLGTGVSERAPA